MTAATDTNVLADDALDIGVDVPTGDDAQGTDTDKPGAVGQDGKPKEAATDLAHLTDEQIKAYPPEVQAFVRSLQADHTVKTQALADDRRDLEGKSAYLDLAEQISQVRDEEGPGAAANLLREAADQFDGGKRTATTDSAGRTDGQPGQDQLQQLWEGAQQIVMDPNAAPNERHLAQSMLSLVQIAAASAQEVREVKQSSQSGLQEAANREITQTLTTLHDGEYKALEPDADKFATKVLETAKRERITNLPAAAKLAYHDDLIQRARGEATKRASDKANLPDGEGGSGAGPATQGDAKTVDEAFSRALAKQRAKGR